MRRCPNCESEARDDAKFCTNCGHRFAEAQSGDWGGTAPGRAVWGSSAGEVDEAYPPAGWPATTMVGASESAGADLAVNSGSPSDEPAASPLVDEYAGFWPEPASDSWATMAPAGASSGAANENQETTLAADGEEENAGSAAADSDAHAAALHLLDQLRAAIVSIPTTGPGDLTGVISDLEVAATPPGAVPLETLAELREAVFAAREHPRDIDTIVDLTKRIDALAALVIAYDRAIAAIERSLEALRRADQFWDTALPFPDEPGENLG